MTTEEKILKASLKLFSKYGYNGASTRKIAQESGVNEVTIFRKFENKSNLFQQVITNYSKEGNIIEKLNKEITGIFEKDLMIFAKNFYLFLVNNELFYKIQVKQVDEDNDKFTNSLEYKEYFRVYLEKKKDEGEFLGDPGATAVLLVSSIMGIFTFQIFNKTMLNGFEIEKLVKIEVKKIILENNIQKTDVYSM